MTTLSNSPETREATVSRRERCAWINLVTTVVVNVPYFIYLGRLLGSGQFHTSDLIEPFLVAVVAQIVLVIIGTCLFALPVPSEPRDERDAALETRSLRTAYYVLAAAGFSLVVLVPIIFGPVLVARADVRFVLLLATQLFLLCFVTAEVTRYGLLVIGYRRGF